MSSDMFKIFALGNKKSISNLSRHGRKSSYNHVTIIGFIEPEQSSFFETYLAFAASKKQFAKAVDRNRVKRRYRAALRNVITKNQQHFLCSKLYLMIIPRKPTLSLKFEQISESLEHSLNYFYERWKKIV